jgi:hypothetical protein
MSQFGAPLTDDSRVIIYDCNMSIIQARGVSNFYLAYAVKNRCGDKSPTNLSLTDFSPTPTFHRQYNEQTFHRQETLHFIDPAKLGEGKGAKLGEGKGAKLCEGCPKVRLSQDRMSIPSPLT